MIPLDEVVANPPIVHGGRATFSISPSLCRFIDEILSPHAITLETGAGLSTASCPAAAAATAPSIPRHDITVAFGARPPSRISSQPINRRPCEPRYVSILRTK